MGSFNVSCGLSGLPIQDNDRAGFVVLSKSQYKTKERGAILTDACQYYSPRVVPVYGTYDSYGRIVDTEPGFGSVMLEKLFNRPADTVVSTISEGRDLYDSSVASSVYLINGSKYQDVYGTEERLLLIGYEKNADGSFSYGDTRLVLKGDNIREVHIKGTSLPLELFGHSYSAHQTIFNVARYTQDYPGVTAEDQDAVHLLGSSYGMFLNPEVFEEMKDVLKANPYRDIGDDRFTSGWDVMQKQFAARASMDDKLARHEEFGYITVASAFRNHATEMLQMSFGLPSAVYETFEGAKSEDVEEMFFLSGAATLTARFIGPSMYVTEDGPWAATRALIEVMSKISEQKLSEYNEYMEGL